MSNQFIKNRKDTKPYRTYAYKRHHTQQNDYQEPRRKPSSYGLQRMSELKPMIDKIISQCQIESKQVRSELHQLKDYQLQVLDELQQVYDDLEQQNKSLRQSSRHQMMNQQDKLAAQVINLREQKLQIMKELNEEIRKNNALTKEVKRLEQANQKLKRQLRNRQDDTENQNQSIINKLKGDQRLQSKMVRIERENAKLKDELARLYDHKRSYADQEESQGLRHKITLLQEDLGSAEQQIRRLQRRKNQDNGQKLKEQLREAQQRIHSLEQHKQNEDLKRQFAKLKEQNQYLRIQTIRLLKKTENMDNKHLQEEIIRLHDTIEKQNEAKKRFLEDMNNFKKQSAKSQSENRHLRKRIEDLEAELKKSRFTSPPASRAHHFVSQTKYQSRPSNEMASLMAEDQKKTSFDSRLDKYKSVLSNLRNVRS